MSYVDFIAQQKKELIPIFIMMSFPTLFYLLAVFFNKEQIFLGEVNKAQGLLAIFAIVFAVGLWRIDLLFKIFNHRKKQEQYLQLLLVKLDYVSGGILTVFGESVRPSITDSYLQTLSFQSVPAIKIPNLDADYFARVLDNKIDNKSSFDLKKALYLIQDTVDLANSWIEFLMKNKLCLPRNNNEKQMILSNGKEAIELIATAVSGLKSLSQKTAQYITETFGTKLPTEQ
ncbi:MAG: hypothetical protein PHD95_00815 [Candidatus ainarchaeum sp.]|nr:hypothetical protein [Candidatus ainarchaeum sp.]